MPSIPNHYELEPTSLSNSCAPGRVNMVQVNTVQVVAQVSEVDERSPGLPPNSDVNLDLYEQEDNGYGSLTRPMNSQRGLGPNQRDLVECSSTDACGYESIKLLDCVDEVNPRASETQPLNHAADSVHIVVGAEPTLYSPGNDDDRAGATESAAGGEIGNEAKSHVVCDGDLV